MRLYLYIALLLISLLALYHWHSKVNIALHNAEERDYMEIAEEGALRIAIDYNTIDMYVSGDSLQGLQYQIIQHLARLTSLSVEVVPMANLQQCLDALNSGHIDVIARSIPITQTLQSSFHLSRPIYNSRIVLIQRKSEYNNGILPLRNQLDLAQKTIVLPARSPYINRLVNLSHEISDTIHLREEPLYGTEQLIVLVASGDIEYTVCDLHLAEKMKQNLPQIDIATNISFSQQNGWVLRKDSPILLDSLNAWLNHLELNGTLDELAKKYAVQ